MSAFLASRTILLTLDPLGTRLNGAWQLAGQWCHSAAWLWVVGKVEEAAEVLEAVEGLLLTVQELESQRRAVGRS